MMTTHYLKKHNGFEFHSLKRRNPLCRNGLWSFCAVQFFNLAHNEAQLYKLYEACGDDARRCGTLVFNYLVFLKDAAAFPDRLLHHPLSIDALSFLT